MSSVLTSPNTTFLKFLYLGNALWHTSAFIHFGFRQPFMMRKLSCRRTSSDPSVRSTPSGDLWHADIMSYLSGLNVPYAVLAAIRLLSLIRSASASTLSDTSGSGSPSAGGGGSSSSSSHQQLHNPEDVLALTVLALANFSQAFCNFTIARTSGRWIMGRGWDRITVLDTVFSVLDAWAAWSQVRASS